MMGSRMSQGAIHKAHMTVVGCLLLVSAAEHAAGSVSSGSLEMASVVDREQSGQAVVGNCGQRSLMEGGAVTCNILIVSLLRNTNTTHFCGL